MLIPWRVSRGSRSLRIQLLPQTRGYREAAFGMCFQESARDESATWTELGISRISGAIWWFTRNVPDHQLVHVYFDSRISRLK